MPTVSVIIPTYNRAEVLPRAIDSALDQTLSDVEVIVIDDASTDDTETVVTSYDEPRVTYLAHETNRGGSAARNTGIEVATGDYIALLDSDDEWAPTKLERQVETLEQRSSEWVAAYCGTTLIDDEGANPVWERIKSFVGLHSAKEGREGGEELVKEVLMENLHTSAGSTLIVDSDVVDQIGGFDESFDRYQDTEFLIRVLKQGKLAYIDEPLLRRYPSGGPSADSVRQANTHYLRTFAEDVVELETRGYDVTGIHQYALASLYLREGRFNRGLAYLRAGQTPGLRQLPGLLYTVCTGIQTRLTD
ncbi:glycosyltransferase (plasmid) [Haloferax mediterranei ATCC 33500]|uniref:Glycosyl transferase n=1 Tax=Haloferax mediterranei (strain ATCC 33500 / DSM 1411 / JCM 8866 / NBRC 14739 / NCIMB 2177 / R-4) TaxID=523841 RepID=I3RAL0_HALMT|nr:glycosyltransferase family 2 protein [Haloferax mediterranei]AFK21270.1 glycosyl transferase [Haloferax mediterranei ATCC 33500]AHZ24631.1 glycosyl transferase family 2 [Haloferax mediterranei ATCC 33500]ELZ97398.1 glycosyl transferase family protein [Haloferax mediterranei ATCC 33500]MDX5990306.1 glycosyltransferase family 2 protein [Haloferax mediterranei ATCC 33500]QCQ77027.1 glycosyltransferase [Haloferax mediterranei ATCC 33500]